MVNVWKSLAKRFGGWSDLTQALIVAVFSVVISTVIYIVIEQVKARPDYTSDLCDHVKETSDGHLIAESDLTDVWLVKIVEDKRYRRLLPGGANSASRYDKEGCDVKIVGASEFEEVYEVSNLVRIEGRAAIYLLSPFPQLENDDYQGNFGKWERLAGSIDDLDPVQYKRESIFEILQSEFDLYDEW